MGVTLEGNCNTYCPNRRTSARIYFLGRLGVKIYINQQNTYSRNLYHNTVLLRSLE
jgi:hypothetical protein